MRAYMYDTGSGLYQGETFEYNNLIKYVNGLTTVPPPNHEKGFVAVFHKNRQVWSIVPIGEMRERLSHTY